MCTHRSLCNLGMNQMHVARIQRVVKWCKFTVSCGLYIILLIFCSLKAFIRLHFKCIYMQSPNCIFKCFESPHTSVKFYQRNINFSSNKKHSQKIVIVQEHFYLQIKSDVWKCLHTKLAWASLTPVAVRWTCSTGL